MENRDVEYQHALAETNKLLEDIEAHLLKYEGMACVPPLAIDARTPIGRVQFVEEAIKKTRGMVVRTAPAGRLGWDCQMHFLGPEGTRATAS